MSAVVKASADYKKLLSDITHLYQESRQALVKAYWQIGRRIVEVEQRGEAKPTYGTALIQKLSEDLSQKLGAGFSETNLKRFRQFYLTNPISPPADQLTWAHHTELLTVHDKTKRRFLGKRAEERSLNRDGLRTLIRQETIRASVEENLSRRHSEIDLRPPELLKPIRGSLYTYRLRLDPILQSAEPALRVDLGFSCYKALNTQNLPAGRHGFKEGDIVESTASDTKAYDTYALTKSSQNEKNLFTFKAYIERVVDGDTLVVQVDLGFSLWTRQYLRLRGIDCPELDTPEGKKAKKFVERELETAPYVIISSTKSDKYDRYLADVFYTKNGNELFLNNGLLEERLAVRA